MKMRKVIHLVLLFWAGLEPAIRSVLATGHQDAEPNGGYAQPAHRADQPETLGETSEP
jgi:hypothetical protein